MELFKNVTHYFGIYRAYIGRRLYVIVFLMASVALVEGFGIAMLLPLLKATGATGDSMPVGRVEMYFHKAFAWIGIADSVPGILVLIAVVFLAKGLLKFGEGAYRGYLYSQLLQELKLRMFDTYKTVDYQYFTTRNTGHFINVINSQVNRFAESFIRFAGVLSKFVKVACYFAIAFVLTWRFAAMALVVGVVAVFLFKYLNAYVRDLSRKTSEEHSTLNKLLVQTLQAFKYVTSTNQKGRLRTSMVDSIRRLREYAYRQQVARALTSALREPVSVAFIIAIVLVQVVAMGQAIAPIFVSILLFNRGIKSAISLQGSWQQTMNMIGSVEMVDDDYKEATAHQEPDGDYVLSALDEGIRLENVSFRYDESDTFALKDLSLEIQANTTVAFVGESGAGKSTLVDVLTLLLQPQQGQMRIDGAPGEKVEKASWRSQIGYVTQDTVVFDDTVANNISLWAEGDASSDGASVRARIREAAEKAYAAPFIEEMSNGYDTRVGDRGVRLSGGQRQRLFLARELFKNPNLLILDEATSALDTESERYIQKNVDALKRSTTVVIIAHRLSTIKNVDQVYVLEEGRIIEQGSYQQLTSERETRFREMVDMQRLHS